MRRITTFRSKTDRIYDGGPIRLEGRECLLLFSVESFVFQFAIQKVKDQDI